jgi:hypothetical protein
VWPFAREETTFSRFLSLVAEKPADAPDPLSRPDGNVIRA